MKGIRGLLVALGLGMVGALCNFVYLNKQTQDVTTVQFVGIKPGVTVKKGEPITVDQLTVVAIPRNNVGNLTSFAVPQTAQATVIGRNASRMIPGGSLVLNDDTRTAPTELDFGQTAGPNEKSRERGLCIPFDTRSFIPSLLNPGDEVSLLVPKVSAAARTVVPTPAGSDKESEPAPAADPALATGSTEALGPFKVLSVGNRLGSVDVMLAGGMRPSQENVLTISVMVDAQGNLEAKAQRLWDLVRVSNFQGVGVLLHPRARK